MSETVIKCESVYKIFGQNAKKMLEESNGNVDAKTFQERGCIVGVNNASLLQQYILFPERFLHLHCH